MSLLLSIPDYILYEDDSVLVLNKPASLMVEPDRNGHPNLLQQVQKYLRAQLPKGTEVYAQHIHRLDRPVSGIILFAKQRSVLKNLSEQFAQRSVKKYYQALTAKAPDHPNGTIDTWLRKEKKKAVIYEAEVEYAERAILHYEVSAFGKEYFLWSIALQTGKYHQIRAQLAYKGCPVLGDVLYGSDKAYRPDCIALHASKLIFQHPITNEEICIEEKIGFEV